MVAMSSTQRANSYGPSAIATPANLITLIRIGLAPLLVFLVLSFPGSVVPVFVWAGISISDSADGYIARRQGVTRSGAFLDPLADKIVVFSAFGALWVLHRVAGLPIVIMGARELSVSLYRTRVLASGKSLPARLPGKLKMVSQIAVIGLALIPGFAEHDRSLINGMAWFACALAIVSAVQYFLDSRSVQS
jgi:CDP-diacylglycerol--glycerol-3-phosphate 3-phosphatidyltransferase